MRPNPEVPQRPIVDLRIGFEAHDIVACHHDFDGPVAEHTLAPIDSAKTVTFWAALRQTLRGTSASPVECMNSNAVKYPEDSRLSNPHIQERK